MRALVTGAAGFIGSHVVRELAARGHHVRALHLPTDDTRNLADLSIERAPGDVTRDDDLRRAMTGCDAVFHLAAVYALWLREPRRFDEVNVEGTRRVLAIARELGVRRVVHTSSIAVFGGQGRDRDATEASPFALGSTGDRYAKSKLDAHRVAEAFAADGLDVTIVAPTGPIGPGDVGPTPTGRVLLAALRMPFAFAADTITNVVDVRDLARGHVLAFERGARGESYLLGGENRSMRELVAIGLRARGQDKPILSPPRWMLAALARAMDVRASILGAPPLFTRAALSIADLGLRADAAKARRVLGFSARPIGESLADAIAWFEAEGYLARARAQDGRGATPVSSQLTS